MNNLKYSNQTVMYIVSAGYLILIMAALSLHLNIMYVLAPYALLTFWGISYTQKRSVNFIKYWIGFELGMNEKGNFFKFFIFASRSNEEVHLINENEVEIIKVSQFQTQYILNVHKLQAAMADVKYIVDLPSFTPQSVLRAPDDVTGDNADICSSSYKHVCMEYTIFKNAMIDLFKRNTITLLEANINQPVFAQQYKKRSSITSFLRAQ